MRFDHNVVKSFMPNDTVYVTILRKPSALFSSALRYMASEYNPCFGLKSKDNLEEFVKKVEELEANNSSKRNGLCGGVPSHDFNAYDFGTDLRKLRNHSYVGKKTKEIFRLSCLQNTLTSHWYY